MAPDVVAPVHCPNVPALGRGTVGQSSSGTEKRGTECGTIAGTVSLKALAMCQLMRDSARDTCPAAPLMPVPLPTVSGTDSGTLSLSPGFLFAAQPEPAVLNAKAVARRAAELLAAAQRNPAIRITDRANATEYFTARATADAVRELGACRPTP